LNQEDCGRALALKARLRFFKLKLETNLASALMFTVIAHRPADIAIDYPACVQDVLCLTRIHQRQLKASMRQA
jgi:hypothetical protein